MVRFLHSADWQLGMTRHFLDDGAQARFDAARIDAVSRIGELAVAERCGFVVVGGDVFETNAVARRVVVQALDAMASTPSVTFYLLPGNHDPLDAASVFTSRTFRDHRPDNVVVVDDAEPIDVGGGVQLVGAPWRSKRPLEDLVDRAVRDLPADGTVRIVLGHGALDVLSPDRDDPAVVALAALEEHLAAGRVHYVALGDRHSATDVGGTGRVRYSGAPEPTSFREDDPGKVLVVELDDQHFDVEERRVGTWRFELVEMELTGATDVDLLDERLSSIADKSRTIVRHALRGQLSLAERDRLDRLLEHHGDLLASLQGWERRTDLVTVPDDSDLDQLGLVGFARSAMEDLQDLAAGDGPEVVAAGDALGVLYRLGRHDG